MQNEQPPRTAASDRPMADIASAPMEFVAVPGSDQHVRQAVLDVLCSRGDDAGVPAGRDHADRASRPAGGARTAAPRSAGIEDGGFRHHPGRAGAREQKPAPRAAPRQRALRRGRRSWPRPKRWPGAQRYHSPAQGHAVGPRPGSTRRGTAGLARVQRIRLAVGAALVLGGAAFAAGITLIVTDSSAADQPPLH